MSKSDGTDTLVLLRIDAQVATVTLNRPQRHNSLVPELLRQISGAFRTIARPSQSVRVVVLQAAGASFSTGGDLGAFLLHRDDVESFADELVGCLHDAMVSIVECEVPVVVAVDGQVTGGAMGLVLAGDIVIVTDRASFTPCYTEVGFSPDGGWTALLPGIIGRARAAAVLLLNDTLSARQAINWGIACSMVDAADLQRTLDATCARIVCGKKGSVRATKRLLKNPDYREQLDRERRAFVKQIVTQEALGGIEDFVRRSRAGA